MTNQLPKLSSAAEAEAKENVGRRPQWARERYSVTHVTGKVTKMTEGQTDRGYTIYQLHIAQPKDVQADVPVSGEVVLAVDAPNMQGKLGTRQGYFWCVESAKEIDPAIDDIGGLVGKEWTFDLSERRPWPEATNSTFYYKVSRAGGAVAAAPTFTKEELYEVYEAAQGLDVPAAYEAYGRDKIERLMLGKLSDGTVLDFGLKTVEGKLVAS